jgi:4-hydroxybenzoate polyprenyltransferase
MRAQASPDRSLGDSRPAVLWSGTFWKAFGVTMRPYLIFVSGAAGLVGLAFIPHPEPWRLLLAFLPLFLSYGFGQALTDCFQIDTDSLSSPYRPLVRGIVSRPQVMTVSLGGLAAGVVALGIVNLEVLPLGLLAVVGLLSYTFFKRRWWGGPFWNSWIVALLPLMGRLAGRDISLASLTGPTAIPEGTAFLFGLLTVFFAYANFVVMGYLKDISADRATGYRTLPVVFGWRATALVSDALALAAIVSAAGSLYFTVRPARAGLIALGVAAALSLSAQVRIHRTRDESQAHGPIADVVRVFLLESSAIVLARRPGWVPLLIVFYLSFEAALRLRPEERQV